MTEITNPQVTTQARRIVEACKKGESCTEIVARLLDGDPPLTDRQREVLIRAAVMVARYGFGCMQCNRAIAVMPQVVRDQYQNVYGPVPPSCYRCEDSLIGKDGLRCLACDGLTLPEKALLLAFGGRPALLTDTVGRCEFPGWVKKDRIPGEEARRYFAGGIERLLGLGLIFFVDVECDDKPHDHYVLTGAGQRRVDLFVDLGMDQ